MKQLYFTFILVMFYFPTQAQETLNERVFVHIDKDCYVAGEEMLVKFFVTDSQLQPSSFSKVGYVEVCDLQKPHLQLKLALERGSGSGKTTIPLTLPSGIYELSGYTRYMRNEGNKVFFKRQIAIVNLTRPSEADRMALIDSDSLVFEQETISSNIQVATDKKQYSNRSKVVLSLSATPAHVTDLVITVARNDSAASPSGVDKVSWLKQSSQPSPIGEWTWQPEYEGHIILGKATSTISTDTSSTFTSGIGFVSNDIHYIHGQQNDDGTILYYTRDVYGIQDVVTSSITFDDVHQPVSIISPFEESFPGELPTLRLRAEDQQLMERFVGVQLKQVMGVDSLERVVPLESYYYFTQPVVYDLDQYTRFSTMRETMIEFIPELATRRTKGKLYISVLRPSENKFSSGNSLLLLDGVPIRNHEEILDYNPRNIKYIHIHNGKYYFGGEFYDCMVSFISHRNNLSAIQLRESSQMIAYDCPSLPMEFIAPEYPDEATRNSLTPDFRHTLYWNPYAEKLAQPASLSFYSSDICGEFKVTVEGFTGDGKAIHGTTYFRVTP